MNIEQMKIDREEGMTLKEIGDKHGVHASTVMRALKKETKDVDKLEEIITNQIYQLATQPLGIQQKLEYAIYSSAFDVDAINDVRKRIRSKVIYRANKDGRQALFIPDWVDTESPRDSYNTLLSLAHDLNERLEEAVQAYMAESGIADAWPIREVLCQMAIPRYAHKSVVSMCDQWNDLITTLENNRNELDVINSNPDTRY